ncbi:unknown [Clostridium sp. CAG:793]|nr:unknown [Clostridium sp. CAG:793]
MHTIIIIAIIILNIFSIIMLLKMLKGTELKIKIITCIALILFMFIISNIIYGIGNMEIIGEIANKSKNMILLVLMPINMMIIASPIALQINKAHSKEIEKEEFLKKIITLVLIDIAILIVECIYIKNIQLGTQSVMEGLKANNNV